jgi:hypothetical protein
LPQEDVCVLTRAFEPSAGRPPSIRPNYITVPDFRPLAQVLSQKGELGVTAVE